MESGAEGMEDMGMEDMGEAGSEAGGEMVFDETSGDMPGSSGAESEALPDFSEEETLSEAMESFEEAMESAAAEATQGEPAGGGGMPPGGGSEQAQGSAGQSTGYGDAGSTSSGGEEQGGYAGAGGAATVDGRGTVTAAEQVAILDEQLKQGTGDFDDLILRERETIRRTTKSGPGAGEEEEQGSGGYGQGEGGGAGSYTIPPMAGGGGSGQGGPGPVPRESYDADIPNQTAVYPPPADIPSGNDDDVVARQLREAAMREPDPALREKLWDEYRKYKGIE